MAVPNDQPAPTFRRYLAEASYHLVFVSSVASSLTAGLVSRHAMGDQRDGRWHVAAHETLASLVTTLNQQGARSRAIIERHDLAEPGQPGERWEGALPATLERVCFALLQEYARHLGRMDIVRELADGPTGE